MASCWEIAIKASLGKLDVDGPLDRFVADQLAANAFRLLPIELADVARVASLPFHHRDPIDRLLVAQAQARKLRIVSSDPALRRYDVRVTW